jgi:hypothetical protein
MTEAHRRLAFDVALAQLRSQKDDLRYARNQAGMAAALSGLIATVFAGLVEPNKITIEGSYFILSLPLDVWLVISLFFASIYYAAMVGLAQRRCIFELFPRFIITQGDNGIPIEKTFEELAMDCDRYFDENEAVIAEARSNLWKSVVSGCSQVPAWMVVLVS